MTGPLRLWLRTFPTRWPFLAAAAFVFAGDLKNSPGLASLPVDLTLLAGGALACLLVLHWARGARSASPGGLLLLVLWFLTFLPGVLDAADTPYAFQKMATIFTFSLLAALAPFVLVRRDGDLGGLLNAIALFCLGSTLASLVGAQAGMQRLASTGGGTIALGRAAGFLFLFGTLHLAEREPLPLLTLGLTATAAVAALFSGSRGPMVAAALALALTFVAGRGKVAVSRLKLGLSACGLAALLALSLALAPQGSLQRTDAFVHGEFGASEQYRAEAARISWDRLRRTPWGLGWGGFATQVDLDGAVDRQYPHNLLLEVTLESGWLCGAFTVLLLAAALGSAWSATSFLEGRILFAGLAFSIVNAFVSGDLNDHRLLFTFLFASLSLWRPRGKVRQGG